MFSQVSFVSRVHNSLNHNPPASVPRVTGLRPKSQLYGILSGVKSGFQPAIFPGECYLVSLGLSFPISLKGLGLEHPLRGLLWGP